MVLPEELVNYVKDQLIQDTPVANIISDVKSKGYQISSSTIYKIRASIQPKKQDYQKIGSAAQDTRQENTSTAYSEQMQQQPIAQQDGNMVQSGISLAAIDIQETKILLKVYKNDQELISKSYQFQANQMSFNTSIYEVNAICSQILINQIIITSFFLMPNQNVITLPNNITFNSADFKIAKIYVKPYPELIAARYSKLFKRDIILMNFDSRIQVFEFNYSQFSMKILNIQHMLLLRHPADQRFSPKQCQYHDQCALQLLSTKTVTQPEKDLEYIAYYIAQMIFNQYLSFQEHFFILTGKLINSIFVPTRLIGLVKQKVLELINNSIPHSLPDTFVQLSQIDAPVLGGIAVLEKMVQPDSIVTINPLTPQINNQLQQPYVASPSLKYFKQLGQAPPSDRVPTVFSRIPTTTEGFKDMNQTPLEFEMLAKAMKTAHDDLDLMHE